MLAEEKKLPMQYPNFQNLKTNEIVIFNNEMQTLYKKMEWGNSSPFISAKTLKLVQYIFNSKNWFTYPANWTQAIQFLRGWRRTGRPFTGMANEVYMIFSFGITFSHLNLFTRLCRNTRISNRAYSFPAHIKGPPPKGTNVYGAGPFPSNLEGSNLSGSGKYLGFLCVEWVYTPICLQISSYPSSFRLLHSKFEGYFCLLYI